MHETRAKFTLGNRLRRAGLAIALCLASDVALAAERSLHIEAPRMIKAGVEAFAWIDASTNAGDGERIGFLQVEVSADGGKSWTALCYLTEAGAKASRQVYLPAGQAGSTIVVRARAAFRGGTAGDVDYRGQPIQWNSGWDNWAEPPARHLIVSVRK